MVKACSLSADARIVRLVLRDTSFTVFAQVFIGWSAGQLAEELVERPYVLVGFLAWLSLVPLGITSARTIRKEWEGIGGRFTNSLMPSSCWVGYICSGCQDRMWANDAVWGCFRAFTPLPHSLSCPQGVV